MTRLSVIAASAACALLLSSGLMAQRAEIVVADTLVFPESVTSARDGAVFFGSTTKSIVYRAAPGAASATAWIQPSAAALQRVLGVYADDRGGLLWVCSSVAAAAPGAVVTGETSVKSFDLSTGAFRASYPFPGGRGTCNDVAIAADGTMYATDTAGARVLRLKPGTTAMDVWASGPMLASADGIAILADGAVYVNTFATGTLVRLNVGADGAAGQPLKLETSRPIVRPDGMRSVSGQTMLLVEGDGHLDEVVVEGDRAEIRTLKDGFVGATAVTLVGDQAFVLESKLNYRNDPRLRDQDPGPFRVLAVPYTSRR